MQAMTVRTVRAFCPCGLRSAETVLEMASTPVSEDPPLAKARSSTSTVAPSTRPEPWCTGTVPGRWAGS